MIEALIHTKHDLNMVEIEELCKTFHSTFKDRRRNCDDGGMALRVLEDLNAEGGLSPETANFLTKLSRLVRFHVGAEDGVDAGSGIRARGETSGAGRHPGAWSRFLSASAGRLSRSSRIAHLWHVLRDRRRCLCESRRASPGGDGSSRSRHAAWCRASSWLSFRWPWFSLPLDAPPVRNTLIRFQSVRRITQPCDSSHCVRKKERRL